MQAILDHISANSLRGHLSFIASDLLEGRATPSRGLDIAAEYIAAQFRIAGLEPAGDDGYFQTAAWSNVKPAAGFEMKIDTGGGRALSVSPEQITLHFHDGIELTGAELYKIDADHESKSDLQNRKDSVVVAELPDFSREHSFSKYRALVHSLERAKPKLSLLLTEDGLAELNTSLVTPENQSGENGVRRIIVRSSEALKWFRSAKAGPTGATLSLRLPPGPEEQVKLRNVIGLLRGSDPELKNTYLLVTAHYDHLGVRPDGDGDRIFNGANDDGSGTVSVIELASALTTLNPRPKRSIVFMTFFGEEAGTLGSKYYAHHPVFPIGKTVADVNLEQVGRTDATDGRKRNQVAFTGFDYSDLPRIFQAAGKRTGVRVVSDAPYGDGFFERSDNAPLADEGIPSHTLVVAFDFPDYHRVGDEWQKIDYENMAKVDRMIALGLIMLADKPDAPRWNEAQSKTAPYIKAWQSHH